MSYHRTSCLIHGKDAEYDVQRRGGNEWRIIQASLTEVKDSTCLFTYELAPSGNPRTQRVDLR